MRIKKNIGIQLDVWPRVSVPRKLHRLQRSVVIDFRVNYIFSGLQRLDCQMSQ